jgi:protein MpaA
MNLSLSPPQQNSVTADGLLVTTRLPNQNLKRMNSDSLWAQLPAKMDRQGNLFDVTIGRFRRCGESFSLRKLVFIGPWAGNSPWLRLGVFAGLHGDEPSGVYALMELARELHEAPELARGLEIHFYPLCNPSGFVDNTRSLRGGTDMNREFWLNSCEPEVQLASEEGLI